MSLLGPVTDTLDPRVRPGAVGEVRTLTEALAAPLSPEDQTVQSMPDVSPTKWHRAHTTWFFETFVLGPHLSGYRPFSEEFAYLFNSYYEAVGARHARPERGLLSRPGAAEVGEYRAHVDDGLERLLGAGVDDRVASLVELGLHHEQQHQELMVMDLLHVLSCHPFAPAYRPDLGAPERSDPAPAAWLSHPGGVVAVGHRDGGFGFDNEYPRHDTLVGPFEVADRLVTCGDWLAFIDDDGYRRAELWMSDGWATVCSQHWDAPLYWSHEDGDWWVFGLAGRSRIDPAQPVANVSWYEADAFARWSAARLPSEQEWELAASAPVPGAHLDLSVLRARSGGGVSRSASVVRGAVAVDRVRVPPVPRVPPGAGRHRRVQRQVHGEPAGAARQLTRDTRRPRPGHVPELLPAGGALGVRRAPPGP